MNYIFKNLVFEGGGAKGIAYLGATEVLKKKGILKNIKKIGGASAGAINALLLGLNYSSDELKEILMDLNFKMFLDDSPGVTRDFRRLRKKYGWYKGERFHRWIKGLIEKKTGNPNSTFGEIFDMNKEKKFKEIYFIGANISTGFAEVYSHENYSSMSVADAVRISMSIPLFFAAHRKGDNDVCVDGGLMNNYPIKIFDRKKYVSEYRRKRDYYKKYNNNLKKEGQVEEIWMYNMETLGFRLDSAKEIAVFRDHEKPKPKKIDNLFDYTKCLISAVFNIQSSMHLHSDDWKRSIYIDTLGVSTFDFDISRENKLKLIESGKKCTEDYFEWYDRMKRLPNKPPIH
jgi:NTE family protein